MKIELSRVESAGDLQRERVIIRANENVDLDSFAVFACDVNKEGVPFGGPVVAVYWFGGRKVKAGDLLVVYTKEGQRSEKDLPGGNKSHFFYFERDAPLWKGNVRPILVYTAAWERMLDIDDASEEPTPPKST